DHALTARFFGKARHRRLHAVVHVDRREVRIGADFERHVDRERAVAGVDGLHVQHAFHAVDLLLERSGHGLGDRFGGRARIDGANRHLRRNDVRVRGDRQRTNAAEAREHDEGRYDAREDRPFDEVMRNHAGSSPRAAFEPACFAAASTDTALTTIPGCTLSTPSTMNRSPATSPSVTITLLPMLRPTWIGRISTLLS